MSYGEHKAVLWGKLVTTAPPVKRDSCEGCVNHVPGAFTCFGTSVRGETIQTLAGFSNCSSGLHIYVEAKEDQPASAPQVGGDHYSKRAIQPWDYIAANGLGFFEGNAVKYLTRWKDKGGIEDLKKARHYLDKLIEMESSK